MTAAYFIVLFIFSGMFGWVTMQAYYPNRKKAFVWVFALWLMLQVLLGLARVVD